MQHLELIQKLQNSQKIAAKAYEKLLKDMAIKEAEQLDLLPRPLPKYYCLHRKYGIEPDFINTFLRHAPEKIFYFVTTTDNPLIVGAALAKGHMVLKGEEPTVVRELGNRFMELLDGKGNGRDGSFRGKFNKLTKIADCDAVLEQHFNPTVANAAP